jgi:Xaa-Pro aminopeptidase
MGISEKEYQRRYSAIRQLMQKDDLDALLIYGLADDFKRGNIRYVCGTGRGGCCLFPLEGKPVFLTNSLISGSPKFPRTLEAFNLLDLRVTQTPSEQAVKELTNFDNGHKVGLVGLNCIPVSMYEGVKERFGDRLIDLPEYFKELREIKSPEEIEKLRKAAEVADRVYRRLREIVRPGLSEYAIYGEVKKVIYENGCEYSFDLLDAAGSMMNMAFYPTEDQLETHGTLFMEISPSYQGYYAQLPVTLPVDSYLPRVKAMVEAWNQADQMARQILHPGTRIADIYQVLVNNIHERGFISPLRPGHSLGLDILDFWSVTEANSAVLKPGMVIAIHPCAMEKMGGDGVGMGYTYLITEDGYEQFSQIDLAKDLIG